MTDVSIKTGDKPTNYFYKVGDVFKCGEELFMLCRTGFDVGFICLNVGQSLSDFVECDTNMINVPVSIVEDAFEAYGPWEHVEKVSISVE